MPLTVWSAAARRFEPKVRRWADPLALGSSLQPPGQDRRGRVAGVHRTEALDHIAGHLVDVADGHLDRSMIFMPPQEGKSTTVSQWYPVWLLTEDPTLHIAVVSYQAGKAARWGRRVRNIITSNPGLGIRLAGDSRAADRWETTQGGGMVCVGLEGGITGEPVDVLLIDDPVRGRAEAESKTYRDTTWDWWESSGATRLSARGRVVLMMTRWHADDLAGRLLKREPGEWEVLSVPALAEDDDPLGRAPGEELVSVQNREPGYFAGLERKRSHYVFRSVYQQNPIAAEGNLFKRGSWRFWESVTQDGRGPMVSLGGALMPLNECWRFATVDLATSTKTSADFTVASAWAITPGADLVLLDRIRDRIVEANHWARIQPLLERQRVDTTFVESRMFGTTLVYEAGRAGIPLSELKADTDKLTRALPAASRQNQGRVWLPARAEWLDDWIDEHAEFPAGKNDDQVDTLAYAARVVAAHWLSPGMPAELDHRSRPDNSGVINLMSAPM